MITTRGFLTAVECIKSIFGRGSAPDPLGELTTLPQTPSRLRRGTPLPIPHLLYAFGVSVSSPAASRPKNPLRNFFLDTALL